MFPTRSVAVLKIIAFLLGLCAVLFYCEFLIYYLVVVQCSWPVLQSSREPLKALVVSDPHLLGPRRGHWLDRWRREGQMKTAFDAILTMHKPEAIFFLGDIFDEGARSGGPQFYEYVDRFHRVFHVPRGLRALHVAGNHDVGFHAQTDLYKVRRFEDSMDAPSVRLVTIKGSHFVLINSVAMEGDNCLLCKAARKQIVNISEILDCWSTEGCVHPIVGRQEYSRPIIMQHFPLYRESDMACDTVDSAAPEERHAPFRRKIDALSKESTDFLVNKLKPRAAFGGHTHHGCLIEHTADVVFTEMSAASFSWRNRPDPRYYLVLFTPDDVAFNICGLPKETTMAIIFILSLISLLFVCVNLENVCRAYRRIRYRFRPKRY